MNVTQDGGLSRLVRISFFRSRQPIQSGNPNAHPKHIAHLERIFCRQSVQLCGVVADLISILAQVIQREDTLLIGWFFVVRILTTQTLTLMLACHLRLQRDIGVFDYIGDHLRIKVIAKVCNILVVNHPIVVHVTDTVHKQALDGTGVVTGKEEDIRDLCARNRAIAIPQGTGQNFGIGLRHGAVHVYIARHGENHQSASKCLGQCLRLFTHKVVCVSGIVDKAGKRIGELILDLVDARDDLQAPEIDHILATHGLDREEGICLYIRHILGGICITDALSTCKVLPLFIKPEFPSFCTTFVDSGNNPPQFGGTDAGIELGGPENNATLNSCVASDHHRFAQAVLDGKAGVHKGGILIDNDRILIQVHIVA